MEEARTITERLRALGMLFYPLGSNFEEAYQAAKLSRPHASLRRRLDCDVLTPGGYAHMLPVESLYRFWADPKIYQPSHAASFGAIKHHYLGDAALHMQYLYQRMQISIPEAFRAMPDHITLQTELAALYAQANNIPALVTFVTDHFYWLNDYAVEIDERLALLEEAGTKEVRTTELKAALTHLRELVDQVISEVTFIENTL